MGKVGTYPIDARILEKYEILELLGTGGFSEVVKAKNKETGSVCAIKIIANPKDDPNYISEMESIENEINILKLLSHPRIVKLYDCYRMDDYIYVCMELLTGGELFDRVSAVGFFSEDVARRCIKQVLEGVAYLHSMHIAHRDLKPENLLFVSEKQDSDLKITDFGLSRIRDEWHEQMSTQCGSPLYLAPEVIMREPYTLSVDMWSIGVITYILLCGYPPFHGSTVMRMFREIRTAHYDFNPEYWSKISDDAKDFIVHLLKTAPSERMTAHQALKHRWIAQQQSSLDISVALRENLNTTFRDKWKAAIQRTMAVNRFGQLLQEVRRVSNGAFSPVIGLGALVAKSETDSQTFLTTPGTSARASSTASSRSPSSTVPVTFCLRPRHSRNADENRPLDDSLAILHISSPAAPRPYMDDVGVCVCGDIETLGNWDPYKAVPMEWDEKFHAYTTTVPLEKASHVNYKFIKRYKTGDLVWSPGANHHLYVIKDSGQYPQFVDW